MDEISLINNFSFIGEVKSGDEFLLSHCVKQENGIYVNAIREETFIEAYKRWIVPLIESGELK